MEKIDSTLSYVKYNPSWGAEPVPPIPEIALQDLIRQTSYRYPNKTAMISCGKKISYLQMDQMSDRFATALADLGVEKGDRVGVMLPNCAQHILVFHGVIKAGAVSVPCNVMFKGEELAYILNDADIKVFVCLDVFYPITEEIKTKTSLQHIIVVNLADISEPDGWIPPQYKKQKVEIPGTIDFMDLTENYAVNLRDITIEPKEDLALILYTAGTTGDPKGVMETHYNMVYQCITHGHLIGIDYHDTNMQIMPLFHTSGYFLLSQPVFYKGATVVLVPFFEPREFLKNFNKYSINLMYSPPTLFTALANQPDIAEYDLSHLRFAVACGAPVPDAVQKRWNSLTGLELVQGWGMTEINAGGIVSLPNKKNIDSIGVPFAGEVKIVDADGDTVPRGEPGEILFRGPQVAKGYWGKPELTAETFLPDGWVRSGDIGYVGEDDFLYFVERNKDLIIASGYNVAPAEVESLIMKHPAVREVGVIGIADEYRGETIKAFVSLRNEYIGKISPDDIRDFCQETMATYKRPRVVEIMDELPKSAVGKILRRKLRDYEKTKQLSQ